MYMHAMARHRVDPADRDRSSALAGQCAVFNLRKASRALTQVYDDALRDSGLRSTQFALLNTVRILSPVTLGRLAEPLVTDRTTLTRNLRPLERENLVRVEAGDDRRERVVSITRKGDAVLERALPLWQGAQKRVAEILGERRLERMLSDLSALVGGARSE